MVNVNSTPEEMRRAAANLLAEAEKLERQPKDEYENGDVIMWTRQFIHEYGRLRPLGQPFSSSPKTYHYIAFKVGGWWYVTGRSLEGEKFTWESLYNVHLRHATNLWYVSEWTRVEL